MALMTGVQVEGAGPLALEEAIKRETYRSRKSHKGKQQLQSSGDLETLWPLSASPYACPRERQEW